MCRRTQGSPKQKLAIQIADVDRVHINDMDVLEARQREVREDLASKAACADDEDLRLVAQEVLDLCGVSIFVWGVGASGKARTPSPAGNAGSVRGPGVLRTWSMW